MVSLGRLADCRLAYEQIATSLRVVAESLTTAAEEIDDEVAECRQRDAEERATRPAFPLELNSTTPEGRFLWGRPGSPVVPDALVVDRAGKGHSRRAEHTPETGQGGKDNTGKGKNGTDNWGKGHYVFLPNLSLRNARSRSRNGGGDNTGKVETGKGAEQTPGKGKDTGGEDNAGKGGEQTQGKGDGGEDNTGKGAEQTPGKGGDDNTADTSQGGKRHRGNVSFFEVMARIDDENTDEGADDTPSKSGKDKGGKSLMDTGSTRLNPPLFNPAANKRPLPPGRKP